MLKSNHKSYLIEVQPRTEVSIKIGSRCLLVKQCRWQVSLRKLRCVQALEKLLSAMHVKWVVVPCLSSLLLMWNQKFGYKPVTKAEQEALEDQIVFMDPATTYLVKKSLLPLVPLHSGVLYFHQASPCYCLLYLRRQSQYRKSRL